MLLSLESKKFVYISFEILTKTLFPPGCPTWPTNEKIFKIRYVGPKLSTNSYGVIRVFSVLTDRTTGNWQPIRIAHSGNVMPDEPLLSYSTALHL
jgi:hypothetical protein